MSEDPNLPPSQNDAPPTGRARRCICEFCGCALTPDGEIVRMGAAARKYRDQNDQLENLQAEAQQLRARVESLSSDLADARRNAPPAPAEVVERIL